MMSDLPSYDTSNDDEDGDDITLKKENAKDLMNYINSLS
jgi:hypothetical protein